MNNKTYSNGKLFDKRGHMHITNEVLTQVLAELTKDYSNMDIVEEILVDYEDVLGIIDKSVLIYLSYNHECTGSDTVGFELVDDIRNLGVQFTEINDMSAMFTAMK